MKNLHLIIPQFIGFDEILINTVGKFINLYFGAGGGGSLERKELCKVLMAVIPAEFTGKVIKPV